MLVIGWAIPFIVGCSGATVHSQVSATVQGRRVTASVSGPASISNSPNNDAAVVTLAERTVLIEKERISIDGKLQVSISADAKEIRINYDQGTITIVADGEEVLKRSL
jgi:hypothetical protein